MSLSGRCSSAGAEVPSICPPPSRWHYSHRTPCNPVARAGATVRAEEAVQFRILGPFEVAADDGVLVALGGPKPRALLAKLLLHAGTVVPTDGLVDSAWGCPAAQRGRGPARLRLP